MRTEALPPVAPVLSRQRLRLGTVALVLFAATYAVLGLSMDVRRFTGRPLLGFLDKVQEALSGFRGINTYGLFAVMTTERQEIVIEGSADGQTWKEFLLPYRPGRWTRLLASWLRTAPDSTGRCGSPRSLRVGATRGSSASRSAADPTVRHLFTEDPYGDAAPLRAHAPLRLPLHGLGHLARYRQLVDAEGGGAILPAPHARERAAPGSAMMGG